MSFETPLFLLLLVLLPPAVYVRHFWPKRGGRLKFSFSMRDQERFAPPQGGVRALVFLCALFFWGGCGLIIIALAGPVTIERERVYLTRGLDIMIVLDESPSMGAKDFPPENRFQSARRIISSFVEGREHDPVGLVTFGEEAALRVPPTLDYEHFFRTLNDLFLMDLGDGTAIGMGISVAALHLRHSTAPGKVIILLTDGENNAGEVLPRTAATIAAKMGIRIYTIGIGGEGEVPLEYQDPETGKTYTGTYKSGFDEELLRSIADIGEGDYFHAATPGALESIFNTIDSMETFGKRAKVRVISHPLHRVFMYIALGFILLYFLVKKVFLKEVMG